MSWVVGVYSSILVASLPIEWSLLLACLRSDCLVLEQLFLGLAVAGAHVASSCWNGAPMIIVRQVWLCSPSTWLPVVPCICSSNGVGVVLVVAFVVDLLPVAMEVLHVACDCSTIGGPNVGCSHMPKETGRSCSTHSRGR